MVLARRNKDQISRLHRGKRAVGKEEPLAFLAKADFIAVVIMQHGEMLRVGERNGCFIVIYGSIGVDGECGEKNLMLLFQ